MATKLVSELLDSITMGGDSVNTAEDPVNRAHSVSASLAGGNACTNVFAARDASESAASVADASTTQAPTPRHAADEMEKRNVAEDVGDIAASESVMSLRRSSRRHGPTRYADDTSDPDCPTASPSHGGLTELEPSHRPLHFTIPINTVNTRPMTTKRDRGTRGNSRGSQPKRRRKVSLGE